MAVGTFVHSACASGKCKSVDIKSCVMSIAIDLNVGRSLNTAWQIWNRFNGSTMKYIRLAYPDRYAGCWWIRLVAPKVRHSGYNDARCTEQQIMNILSYKQFLSFAAHCSFDLKRCTIFIPFRHASTPHTATAVCWSRSQKLHLIALERFQFIRRHVVSLWCLHGTVAYCDIACEDFFRFENGFVKKQGEQSTINIKLRNKQPSQPFNDLGTLNVQLIKV